MEDLNGGDMPSHYSGLVHISEVQSLSVPPDQLSVASLARRWLNSLAGVLLGSLTGVLEACYVVLSALAIALCAMLPRSAASRVNRVVGRVAIVLTRIELARVARFEQPVRHEALNPRRCWRYLSMRGFVGGLGAGVFLMLVLCAVVAGAMLSAWIFSGSWGLIENASGRVDTLLIILAALPGILLISVTTVGITGVGTLDRWLATQSLGTSTQALLQRRVAELTSTRAQAIEAINEERRRIERDLHDGVQQRLVTLGMLIGRARRTSEAEQRQLLLRQAHVASQEAISELREVASRVYPAALDAGLHPALESLAERAGVRIRLTCGLSERLGVAMETVIYFVVSEAVTNAYKHAKPTHVEVSVTQQENQIVVVVSDDGVGGADPSGPGLSGLARRVAAVDGTFGVRSPEGGPTVVEAGLPCA